MSLETRKVAYTEMKHGTKEDYELLFSGFADDTSRFADVCLGLVRQQDGENGAHPISRMEHSLQAGTRAVRDGASDEMVTVALLHDIGDVLALHNHSAVSAEILRPFISEENYWVIKHHGIFQKYYYAHHLGGDRHERDQFKDHPYFKACVRFCERYDQNSFDPDYDTLPIEHFEPIVKCVFAESRAQWV